MTPLPPTAGCSHRVFRLRASLSPAIPLAADSRWRRWSPSKRLATLVALKEAGDPLPAAGVCLSPWVDLEGVGDSMTSRDALDPMVHKPELLQMAGHYLNGADPRTPLAAPLYADLAGLPPLLIQVGAAETLFDDSTRFAAKAKAAGVDVTLEEWPELFHVFQAFSMLPEAREATDKIGAFIRERTKAPAGVA